MLSPIPTPPPQNAQALLLFNFKRAKKPPFAFRVVRLHSPLSLFCSCCCITRMNVMAAQRSFSLTHESKRGAIISMSRAVFTSFFPHSLVILYHKLQRNVKFIMLFSFQHIRHKFPATSATSVLVERGEVMPHFQMGLGVPVGYPFPHLHPLYSVLYR